MELQLIGSLLFLLVSSVLTQQVRLSSRSEFSALLNLRSSLGIRATYWQRKTDPCSNWTGVDCQSGRVVGINLSGLRRTRVGQLNPQFGINSLANFTLLVSFNSSGFSLPGSIPDWFGSSLGRLQRLDLTSCSIIGPIPSSIGAMNRLNYLNLSDNSLTGVIPSTMGNLLSLSILDLSGNLLTGSIPSGLSALGNLTKLDLSSNFLSGSIPSGFGILSSLQVLKLYNNSLTASIPAELGNVSRLVELDLGFNSLSGLLPRNLIGLTSLERLAVRNNDLEGPFPSGLLSNRELRVLDISSNNFSDVIPDLTLFFNLTDAVFNFSNNLFYGNLSVPVGRFGLIDLSNNYMQGSVPDSVDTNITVTGNCFLNVQNQRQLEDCRMFYAERSLPFDDGVSIYRMQPHRRRIRLTYIMVGLFGGLGFIVIMVLLLVIILKTRNKGNVNDRGTANVGPAPEEGGTGMRTGPPPSKGSIDLSGLGESLTYKQMLQATSDFSDTNLIKHGHSGDLFLGKLEGGFSVVIKRVDLNSLGEEFYIMELDLFSKLTHTRMVPLLGQCLEHENEKLLVYKYMPNGDLFSSLHRSSNLEDDSLQSLDWITRLKIAIGAAEALSYLHHECNPPLVHRDVQASSILLDDKYEVRLGSLSEVRAQGGDNHSNVITRLLRKPQISDPGPSGSSSTTCAYDVYCFGKVLLELVTGKLGISNSDDASTREWLDHNVTFISRYDKELVVKIVDQSLIVDEDLLEEVWAVAIVAKSCLNPKPSKRPLMRHIHRALENPFKVVREENFSPARLTSSRSSWSAAFFGSWHHSSSESDTNKKSTMGALKQAGRVGSQGSGTYEHSSSHKRFSSEIFPEPMDMQDEERQDVGRR